VVSERDLGGRNGSALRAGKSVADLMTPRAVTADPRAPVRQAANLLRGRSIGCLPIVDGDRLVGIVTLTDLLDLIGRGYERPVERTRRRPRPREAVLRRRDLRATR
jgi:acetoin utilization protein AcuB